MSVSSDVHKVLPATILKVSQPTRTLAGILSLFESNGVREDLLLRIREPRLIWGTDGELLYEHAETVGVIQDPTQYNRAICELQQNEVINIEEKEASSRSLTLSAPPLYPDEDERCRWEIGAMELVIHGFPIDRRSNPVHSYCIAQSILPYLQHVHRFFADIRYEIAIRNAPLVTRIVEVYLSASTYVTPDWKQKLQVAMEELVDKAPADTQLKERVRLRKDKLSHILERTSGSREPLNFPRINPRSNTYYGEYLLFRAEELLDMKQYKAALEELDKFCPFHPWQVSTFEMTLCQEMNYMRGKIHHFSGNFEQAKKDLLAALDWKPSEAAVSCKAISHLSSVFCELGEVQTGLNYANNQLSNLEAVHQPLESGSGKRLRLAVARAHLMAAMWLTHKQPSVAYESNCLQSLASAEEMFRGLLRSYRDKGNLSRSGRKNLVSIQLGMASVIHIRYFIQKKFQDLQEADHFYHNALLEARACLWKTEYIETIVSLSQSTLMYDYGKTDEVAKFDEAAARHAFHPDYANVGLGTVWPMIIDKWIRGQGRVSNILSRGWERGKLSHVQYT